MIGKVGAKLARKREAKLSVKGWGVAVRND